MRARAFVRGQKTQKMTLCWRVCHSATNVLERTRGRQQRYTLVFTILKC